MAQAVRTLVVTFPCQVLQRCVCSGSIVVRVESRQEAGSEGSVSLQCVVVMHYVSLPLC